MKLRPSNEKLHRSNQRSVVRRYILDKYGLVLTTETVAKNWLIREVQELEEDYQRLPKWLRWLNEKHGYRVFTL